jgi:hypothetical protein
MKRMLALLLIPAFVAGCPKDPRQEPYDPCHAAGTVTVDGKPLAHGMVTYVPQIAESAGGHPGTASIDANGKYTVGNADNGRYKPLRPGEYVVMVVAMDVDRSRGKPAPKLQVPARYANAEESPLRVTLAPGDNAIDLKLTR